jgi:hypothetical protein
MGLPIQIQLLNFVNPKNPKIDSPIDHLLAEKNCF